MGYQDYMAPMTSGGGGQEADWSHLVDSRRYAQNIMGAQHSALSGDTSGVDQYTGNPYSGVTAANLTPEALAREKYHMEHPTGNSLNFFKDMVIPAAMVWGGGYLGAGSLFGGAGAGAAGATELAAGIPEFTGLEAGYGAPAASAGAPAVGGLGAVGAAPEAGGSGVSSMAGAPAGGAPGAFDLLSPSEIPMEGEVPLSGSPSEIPMDGSGSLAPYSGDAQGMLPGEPSGQWGGPTGMPGPSDSSGIMSKLGSAGEWMQKNKLATMMGLGLGLGGLQAYGASRSAKANRAAQDAANQRLAQRQALMDNPPPYSGMNIQPGTRTDISRTAVMNPLALRNYGAGPEMRFFKASGGLPAHGSPRRSAFDTIVHGDGGGQDDNVPAMLSPKEYVLDADVVAALGDGNPDHGAKKLDQFRERIRQHKRGAPTGKIPPKSRSIESYMGRA